jgi:hypothetical protein
MPLSRSEEDDEAEGIVNAVPGDTLRASEMG